MNIIVIGSGYVGTTAAAIFAVAGHKVTAIDIDQTKVTTLTSGKAPFYEAGLDNLIASAVTSGNLVATTSYEAVKDADVVFSCVGTPDNPDGTSNLSYVYDSAKEAAKHMKPGAIFVQKSTVPVGTAREVIKLLPDSNPYVSNPEFLRESTSVYDTVFFDRVVAGGDDESANQAILELHKTVEDRSVDIVKTAGIDVDLDALKVHSGEYISTRLESAELIKVTSNAFLSLKISFANSIAQLADASGADIQEVMHTVGGDKRIGRAFFGAGRGYGGGCFPKDVSGLIGSSESFGVSMPIMTAARDINSQMPDYVISKLKSAVNNLSGVPVAVLGLAFKSGTSDTRKSPAIKLANILASEGADVTVYDPQAMEEAKPELDSSITTADSLRQAVDNAKVVLIATDWPEFKDVTRWLPDAQSIEVLVDSVNCVSRDDIAKTNATYISVGRAL